jgi:hypothetical protein
MPTEDMVYNGTQVVWPGHGSFKASSGLPGHQNAAEQSHRDEGPIPEGLYSFSLSIAKDATMVADGELDTREGIEHLPDTFHFGRNAYTNVAWGPDRVRLTTIRIDDPKSRHRGGFYLHDSTKGYSHGCIEVDPSFFTDLRTLAKLPLKQRAGKTRLYIKVKYTAANASTYGGTLVP